MGLKKKDRKLLQAIVEYLNNNLSDALTVLRYAQYTKYHRAHWLDEYFKNKKKDKK